LHSSYSLPTKSFDSLKAYYYLYVFIKKIFLIKIQPTSQTIALITDSSPETFFIDDPKHLYENVNPYEMGPKIRGKNRFLGAGLVVKK